MKEEQGKEEYTSIFLWKVNEKKGISRFLEEVLKVRDLRRKIERTIFVL
jgi:hypothetical protein